MLKLELNLSLQEVTLLHDIVNSCNSKMEYDLLNTILNNAMGKQYEEEQFEKLFDKIFESLI